MLMRTAEDKQRVQFTTSIVRRAGSVQRIADLHKAVFLALHDVDAADVRAHDDFTSVVLRMYESVERSGVVVERVRPLLFLGVNVAQDAERVAELLLLAVLTRDFR